MIEILHNIPLYILTSASSYFSLAAVIVFLQSFYDPQIKWTNKKALTLGILSAIECILQLFFNDNIIISIILTILYFVVAVNDCERKKSNKIFKIMITELVFAICIVNAIMVALAYIMPNYNIESLEPTLFEEYATQIIYIIVFGGIFFYLRSKICNKGLFIPATSKEHMLMGIYFLYAFILFISVCMFEVEKNRIIPQTLQVIMALSTVTLSTLLPIFIYRNRISEYYRTATEYQQFYLHAELNHFQQYKAAQSETIRFRHDIKNNLLCLNEMLKDNNHDEAIKYLENLLGEVKNLSQKYVSGDEILDSIISAKAFIMKNKGIEFSLDGVFAGGLNIEPIDICNIFSNALDNAIESTENLNITDRKILMKIKATEKLWFITIENSVESYIDTSLLFSNIKYTSKIDKRNHGIGTFSMKKAVEKYGGVIDAECSNKTFTLKIMLSRNNSRQI